MAKIIGLACGIVFLILISSPALAVTITNIAADGTMNFSGDISCSRNLDTLLQTSRGNYLHYAANISGSLTGPDNYHYSGSIIAPNWPAGDYKLVFNNNPCEWWRETAQDVKFSINNSQTNEYFDTKWKIAESVYAGWQGENYGDYYWGTADPPFTWGVHWVDTGRGDQRWAPVEQDFFVRKSFVLKQYADIELRQSTTLPSECYVNGQRTDNGEFADITPLVRIGNNTIACHVKAEATKIFNPSDYGCYYSYDSHYNTNGHMYCRPSSYNIKCNSYRECYILDQSGFYPAIVIHTQKEVFWNDDGGWFANDMPINSGTEYRTVPIRTYKENMNGNDYLRAYDWPAPFDAPLTTIKKHYFADGKSVTVLNGPENTASYRAGEPLVLLLSALPTPTCSLNGNPITLKPNTHKDWNLRADVTLKAGDNTVVCTSPQSAFNTFNMELDKAVPIALSLQDVKGTAGEPVKFDVSLAGSGNTTLYAELHDGSELVDADEANFMLSGPTTRQFTLYPNGLGAGTYAITVTAYDELTGLSYQAEATLGLSAVMIDPNSVKAPFELSNGEKSGSAPPITTGAVAAGLAGLAAVGAAAYLSGQPMRSQGFLARLNQNKAAFVSKISAEYQAYLDKLRAKAALKQTLDDINALEIAKAEAAREASGRGWIAAELMAAEKNRLAAQQKKTPKVPVKAVPFEAQISGVMEKMGNITEGPSSFVSLANKYMDLTKNGGLTGYVTKTIDDIFTSVQALALGIKTSFDADQYVSNCVAKTEDSAKRDDSYNCAQGAAIISDDIKNLIKIPFDAKSWDFVLPKLQDIATVIPPMADVPIIMVMPIKLPGTDIDTTQLIEGFITGPKGIKSDQAL